ncbi:RagB/SusD family nutrient uptake outer membrane protein [Pedobacter miscanthi]|uniref:RagB/SusD family nutrient uptake outer membrane protein n=1 Tax=Pedobacter miscanthi TaxID=2259170 RepID=A0A366KZZ2_9SPHI|nr:RagB/SusD family nutrient uptake outer membrane protein [Pedobacter miscanthi]RBQ06809.1 hypothetical protein DRW42_13660 [Pedobacter miscanthi]
MKTNLKLTVVLLLPLAILYSSCEKLLEIPPSKNQIESGTVFADSTTVNTALLGAYYTLGTVHSSMKFISLYADEYNTTSSALINLEYANGKLLSNNTNNNTLWNNLYSVIYQCNNLLEGIESSTGLSPAAREQFSGEGKFLRAYAYFYLVNCYDQVPLLLSTNVTLNRSAFQATTDAVYLQVVKDLTESSNDLQEGYLGAGRVRANKTCAHSLLARTYLYRGKWQEAISESSKVIQNSVYQLTTVKAEDVFLAGSSEAILQLWMVNGFLTDVAQLIPASPTTLPIYPLREEFYSGFETGDQRKSKWTALANVNSAGQTRVYAYPAKYKNRVASTAKPEFAMALRLSEQYLIRAEAKAQLNQISSAVDDLNLIRTRAGLVPLNQNLSQENCLEAIFKERKSELFGEWGHRFFDLKRYAKLEGIMAPIKTSWKTGTSEVFPIPNNEIIYNPNLKQNNGY